MAIGPVEYLIIGFPGNEFTGHIAPALADLVDRGLINVLDLTFVGKDDDGNVVTVEFTRSRSSRSSPASTARSAG